MDSRIFLTWLLWNRLRYVVGTALLRWARYMHYGCSIFKLTFIFPIYFISSILLCKNLFRVNSRSDLPVALELRFQSWYLVIGVLYFIYFHFNSSTILNKYLLLCSCILGEILGRKPMFPGKDCKIVHSAELQSTLKCFMCVCVLPALEILNCIFDAIGYPAVRFLLIIPRLESLNYTHLKLAAIWAWLGSPEQFKVF